MALVSGRRAPALAALALLLLVTAAPADARRPRGTRRATAAAPKPTNRAVVGIIGGGISGVRAASVLQEAGLTDFLLLEQDSKLGGRMRNAEIAPGEVRARRRGMPSIFFGSQRAGHTARRGRCPHAKHTKAPSAPPRAPTHRTRHRPSLLQQFVELGANWVQGLTGNPIWDLAQACSINGSRQNW